jgi:hypothetical protein
MPNSSKRSDFIFSKPLTIQQTEPDDKGGLTHGLVRWVSFVDGSVRFGQGGW